MTAEELIIAVEKLIAEYRIPTIEPGQALPDGTFRLKSGVEYPRLILRTGQKVLGEGAIVSGGAYPAIYVPPGNTDIYVEKLTLASTYQSVVQLGDNSALTQTSVAQVPARITLDSINIPTHRGKRGVEINATDVTIGNCKIIDVYSTALADSQAIGVLNTPGHIFIKNCELSAGSEVIMIGGDTMKLANTAIANVFIEDCLLYRPLSWQTDGINRAVKNLFEIKAGTNIIMRNCALQGCWKASQDGWAFVITPKNNQYIQDVLIEDCTVRSVSGLVQLLGKDYNSVTPQATRGIVLRRCDFEISKTLYGGHGIVTTMTGGMQDVTFDSCVGTFDGTQIVLSDTNATYGKQGPVTIINCNMPTGAYSIKADGTNYGDPLPTGSPYIGQELLSNITGNTFSNAPSRFKTNFPNNTYL